MNRDPSLQVSCLNPTQSIEEAMSPKKLDWKQDRADYSWFATDDFGYFFRVSKVLSPQFEWAFACAWSETGGLRQSTYLYASDDEAKARMDNLAIFSKEAEQQRANEVAI